MSLISVKLLSNENLVLSVQISLISPCCGFYGTKYILYAMSNVISFNCTNVNCFVLGHTSNVDNKV